MTTYTEESLAHGKRFRAICERYAPVIQMMEGYASQMRLTVGNPDLDRPNAVSDFIKATVVYAVERKEHQ